MKGWIKLHRQLVEWQWADEPNMMSLFVHLLLCASNRDTEWRGTTVARGQLVTGLHALSEKTGISVRGLRTCLSRLELGGEITRKSTNRFTVITICNFDKYQSCDEDERQTNDKQTTNKRQHREKVRSKEEREGEKKQTFSPPSLEEVEAYCSERNNNINPVRWYNHYVSVGWMVGKVKMKDWKAGVRKWEADEKKQGEDDGWTW